MSEQADRDGAGRDARSSEQRAEALMHDAAAQARRWLARAREEIEDVVAEAQSLRRGERPPGS